MRASTASLLVPALLLLAAAPAATFSVPLSPTRSMRTLAAHRCATVMQEEEPEAPAAPETPADRTSPLAGIVGEQSLSEFEKKKAEDNAKRLALRERINIALPATFFISLGIASFFGKEKTQEVLSAGSDPMSKAPGVAEARAKKKERQAQVRALDESRPVFFPSRLREPLYPTPCPLPACSLAGNQGPAGVL